MTDIADDLSTLAVPVDELHQLPGNPRRGDVAAVARSLEKFGQRKPIVARRDGTIVAGNHTWAAARELGWDKIAVVRVDDDDDTAKAFALADNRTAELGTYDEQALVELIEAVAASGDEDLYAATGWNDDDLEQLLKQMDPPDVDGLNDPDDAPEPPKEPFTKPGDVWELGRHKILCGDSTDIAAVEAMMDGDLADCIWTDPPYGVSYVGKTRESLTIQNDGAGGLAELLAGAFAVAVATARAGAPIYVAHADTERIRFETAMTDAGMLVRQNLIWAKNVLVMGRSDYHYKHEPILYGFTPGGEGRLGRGGKRWYGDNTQTTVFQVDRPARSTDHPTMKPVALIGQMLANSCPRRGIVLDLFGGSGSTLMAAHHHGASARLVELDPRYVDVVCRRFQEHTGVMPVLASVGEEHNFLAMAPK